MKTVDLIDRCRQQKRVSLNEAESKQILAEYGLPVVPETVVTTAKAALAAAEATGYPVVLKGLGSQLTHKTELGLVRIDLQSPRALETAFEEIRTAGGEHWEGCLVQPMVSGRREFVAGVVRDAQFGPVIMFGLGGVFAEAIGDVVFRIAPLDAFQSKQMVDDLASRALLGDFRGESAADAQQLSRVLTGLSQLALDHPQIKEVDVNPLIVSADGTLTAVDALVVLEDDVQPTIPFPDAAAETAHTQRLNAAIHAMCHPQSIAVIGVARNPQGPFPGMFRNIRDYGFPGRLYPINPKAETIDGIKAYPSLTALPEKVDLVVISVPGHHVPAALEDCVASGNQNVHIFSSGFKETGEPEGLALQEKMDAIAARGKLNIVGPNCMGLHVPASKLLTWIGAPAKSGPIAMISQSGGNAQDFSNFAARRFGLHFSKVISYGNAMNMDSTDFLAYLAQDDPSRIITMYLEGVQDGRKLLQIVAETNSVKPVVILKGGLSESGARTVASHTGSLAGGEKIWRAFFRQSGAIAVENLEEMAEVVLALNHLPPVKGHRLAILGTGGGVGVAAADSCARAGLDLPAFPPDLLKKLREFIPPAGNMIRNPIDAHILLIELGLLGPTLELLAGQPNLDMFVISLHLDWLYGLEEGRHVERIARYIADQARQHTHGKPLVVVWRQFVADPAYATARRQLEEILLAAGIPVYEGLDRAVNALAKVADYHAFKNQKA